MPAWVVFAVSNDADVLQARFVFLDLGKRQFHFALNTDNANQVLHGVL